MACDAQSIRSDSKCMCGLSEKQLMAAVAYGWCAVVDSNVLGNVRITEEGETRITEEGDVRITE